jgi:hypothetical protein
MCVRYEMRELDQLAKQFSKTSGTVLQNEFSLYQKDLVRDATKFLREIEQTAKKEKTGKVILVAILNE